MRIERKKLIPFLLGFISLMIVSFQTVQALDIAELPVPTGIMAVLSLVPLVLVLVLLFLKVDMVLAGAIAAALAMIIGGISVSELNSEMLTTIPEMLSITVPIINSAVAMAVFKAGSYSAALELVNRAIKGKVEYIAGFIVILVAAATYMSGIGGGSAMVIAPLAFAAVGVVPELIAAMSLAVAASFTTSPASLETSVVSRLGSIDAAYYVNIMRPYWLLFVVLAIVLAFIGTKRRKISKGNTKNEFSKMSSMELFKITIPALFLLFSVIFGPLVNQATSLPIFTPVVYMLGTVVLIFVCTSTKINDSFASMIDGSSYILTRLFQVGIFLAFINIIALTGAFSVIASLAKAAPTAIVVPVAILTGFLIGVPAGAYVGSILALVLPVGVASGFSPLALGLVTIGTGLGSQVCFVNITMQALSSGFQIPILDVVKGNFKWITLAVIILIGISFFVV